MRVAISQNPDNYNVLANINVHIEEQMLPLAVNATSMLAVPILALTTNHDALSAPAGASYLASKNLKMFKRVERYTHSTFSGTADEDVTPWTRACEKPMESPIDWNFTHYLLVQYLCVPVLCTRLVPKTLLRKTVEGLGLAGGVISIIFATCLPKMWDWIFMKLGITIGIWRAKKDDEDPVVTGIADDAKHVTVID